MKIDNVKYIKLAKKYANALIDLSLEANKADKVYEDLVFANETIKANNELSSFLYNPVVISNDKKEVITKIFSVHVDKITLDFLLLMVEQGRLNIINDVVSQYIYAYNRKRNIIKPQIISAVELDENQKNRIISKLQTKFSKNIIPEYQINPDIIGGLVVEIEDKTIDCSIKAKFDNIKKQLTKGNSYGNN